ncbi:hypothetical protein TRFO_05648 [Tritrichomonas foetus]|uniref:FERM domain-containing protein n=1 Tax=Tritrichomonas foetus TaxID=1144522 RepID=A0A1J4K3R1_9EUKA|nr:hypothetical protein TRFO_05648 [Tritrichomonas foetus]|eukprot:OHT06015.1 hypothetical protein TRFO_05648 [Tritrichomonas foetus]
MLSEFVRILKIIFLVMDSGLVTLYTSNSLEDPAPNSYQYYLDYTGSECLNIAMQNLGMYVSSLNSMYSLLLRTNYNSTWLDPSLSLRVQGVQTGNMIIVTTKSVILPEDNLNSSMDSSLFNSIGDSSYYNSMSAFVPPSPISFESLPPPIQITEDIPIPEGPITIETIDVDDIKPMTLDDVMGISNSSASGSESDSDDPNGDIDIFIGDQEADFQTNNFGTFRNYEMNEQSPSTFRLKGKDVRLVTNDGFKKGGNVYTYNMSSSYAELLDEALKNLNIKRDGYFTILIDKATERKVIHENEYLESFNPNDNESIFIFKNEQHVKIHSDNFNPKSIIIDISKTVDELIVDIANYFELDAYLTYGLFQITEKSRPKPLEGSLIIPQQTKSMKNLYFVRQYFIFSREDLTTMESAKIAVKDAIRQLAKDEVFLNEDNAATVLAYYAIAKSEDPSHIDFEAVLLEQNKILPSSCRSLKLSSKVKQISKTLKGLDQFNAIRVLLRYLRKLPGFGCYNFYDNIIELKYRGKKEQSRLTIQVAPFCLRFINPSNSVLEEKISYTSIVALDLLSNTLQIQFSSGNDKTAKYKIVGKDSERIKFLIEQYTSITRKIQHKRARERADKYGGEVIDVIDERDKVQLFTALSLTEENPKRFQYDLKFTGSVMKTYVEQNLGIPHDDDHVLLIKMLKNMYYWIKDDTILRLLNVQNGMTIYLLKNNRPIKIHFSDGHTSTIILDITRPIEELIEPIFHNQKMPPIVGYTLFSLENPQNPKPLDTRFSIPEVCTQWKSLLFKRRFYVISGEVLSNQVAAHSTLCDCREHFLSGTCNATEEEIIEFAILGLYANANDPSDVKKITNIDVSQHVPKGFKVTKKFTKKFMDKLTNSTPTDRFSAARSYLGKVRRLNGFGEEKFTVIYTDLSQQYKGNFKTIRDASILIGPLRIILMMPPEKNEEKVIQIIPYRLLVSFESLGHRLILKFMNNEMKISSCELKIREIDTVLMLINFNIKIIRDLMLAKQRKKQKEQEDNAKKLNGGWIDENGVLRSKMIDFYVTKDLTKSEGLPRIWLELELTGKQVVEFLTPLMKLDSSIEWAILMRLVRQQWKWIPPDKSLEIADPERCSILYILVAKPMIKIVFSMGVTKSIILPIYRTVGFLVPLIASKLGLKTAIGFTLYLPRQGKDPLPLDTNISIPEQTPVYDELLFKRRFFVISKFDTEDDNSLYQTFCDVRALILSGSVDMASEYALKLMYYALKADYKLPLTKETIPKDPTDFLPKGMKPKERVPKFLLDMMKNYPVETKREAMLEYIRIARSLPTFGTESYEIILVEEKKDTIERINCFVFVGPYRVYIKDETLKKELYSVQYKQLLGVNYTDEQMSIKYRSKNDVNKGLQIHIESLLSPQIAGLILSHLEIHKQILMKRIETNDATVPSDKLDFITIFCYDIDHAVKCTYDIKMNGKQVIHHACKYLGIDPEGQYSCLLRISEDQFEWIKEDTILGTLNPVKGLTIHIYLEYMPIQITAPVSNYTRTMLLKISKPIKHLLDEIAFKMFIDNPTGYTLYRQDSNEIDPLDLSMPIPEQVFDFSKLIFKRRFLVFTKEDVKSPINAPQIFPDVKENVLTGPVVAQTNQALELVCYAFMAQAKSIEEAQATPIPNDLQQYLPIGTNIKQGFHSKVKSVMTSRSSSRMTVEKAITSYIIVASKLKNFGCEIFDCYDFPVSSEQKKREKQKKRFLNISIGPNSIVLFDPQTKKDIIFSPYKNIVKVQLIKNNIILTMSSGQGQTAKLNKITIISDKASRITKLLQNYRRIVLPMLNDRDRIQKMPQNHPILSQLLDPSNLASNGIKLKVSRQLNHPNPSIFNFSKRYTCDNAIQVGLNYISYRQEGEYMILTTNFRKRIDTEYHWLSENDGLNDAELVDNSHLFLMKEMPYCQVISERGYVKEIFVNMRNVIFDLCSQITALPQFSLGLHLGFTLYEIWDGVHRPLDFLYTVPAETENYTELILKRRFYLFTKENLREELNLRSAFRDVRNQVLSGKMIIPEETVVELAVYSLYYNASKMTDVLPLISSIDETKLQFIVPANIKSTTTLLKKFKAAATVIVPLSPLQAAYKYVVLANSCIGFGMEEYKCFYTELNNITVIHVPAIIKLCPYYISILNDEKGNSEIMKFIWSNIIDYKREDIITKIKIQNENGMIYNLELESVDDCREIFSFINDMMDLLMRPDLAHYGEFDEDTNDNVGFDDINFGFNFDDAVDDFNYDDINTIEAYENDALIDDAIRDDDANYDFEDKDIDLGRPNNEDDWKWRASTEGLMMTRTNLMLDTLENDLQGLSSLNNLNTDDLNDRLNFAKDELMKFGDIDDNMKNQFLSINNCLDSLRETTQEMSSGDFDPVKYNDKFNSQLAATLEAFKSAKTVCGLKINEIKLKHNEDTDDFGSQSIKGDSKLSFNLLGLSQLMENLMNQMNAKNQLLKPVSLEINDISNSMIDQSNSVTSLSAVLLENKDMNIIPHLITPLLLQIRAEQVQLKDVFGAAKAKGVNTEDFDILLDKLNKMITNIENTPGLTVDSAPKTAKFTLIPGDARNLPSLIESLQNTLNLIDAIKDLEDIKDINDVHPQLEQASKQFSSSITALLQRSKILQANPMNDIARAESIQMLNKLEESMKIIKPLIANVDVNDPNVKKLSKSLTKSINQVDDELLHISTINITPNNIQAIEEDLSGLLDKYSALDHELKDKLHSENSDLMDNSLKELNESKFLISRYLTLLQENPASGETVAKIQKVVCGIHAELPNLRKFARMIEKKTKEIVFPVLIERLAANIKASLIEKSPSEDVTKCTHISKFRQIQLDTGKILNQLNQATNSSMVKRDAELVERLTNLTNRVRSNYIKQIDLRNDLQAHPYNTDIITRGLELIDELDLTALKVQNAARQISDSSMSVLLGNNINSLLKDLKMANTSLDNAPLGVFYKPPDEDTIDELDGLLNSFTNLMAHGIELPSIKTRPVIYNDLKIQVKALLPIIPTFLEAGKGQSLDFYSMTPGMLGKIVQIKSVVDQTKGLEETNGMLASLLNKFELLMKGDIPDVDTSFECLKKTSKALDNFAEVSSVLAALPNITDEARQLLSNLVLKSKDLNATLIRDIKIGDQDSLEMDKNLILDFKSLISQIPSPIRTSLDSDNFDKLIVCVSNLSTMANYAINSIRQLPYRKNISIDSSKYKKISKDDEIEESISHVRNQSNEMKDYLDKLIECQELKSKPATLKLLNEMIDSLKPILTFSDGMEEKDVIKVLIKLKDSRAFMKESSELVAPVVNDKNLVSCERIRMDNIITLIRVLQSPHLTNETSKKMKKDLLPALTAIVPQFNDFIVRSDVNRIDSLIVPLNKYFDLVKQSISNLESPKKVVQQHVVDDNYRESGIVLPILMENPDFGDFQQYVSAIFEICSKYTSLPLLTIRFTTPLQIRKDLITTENSNAIHKVIDAIGSDATSLNSELADDLSNMISLLVSSPESIPHYLGHASRISYPALTTRNILFASSAVRTAISGINDNSAKIDLLEKLAIQTARRAAIQLSFVQPLFKEIENEMHETPNIYNNRQQFWLAHASRSLKSTDTSLLIQCPSIPTLVFNFVPMRRIHQNLTQFVDAFDSSPKLHQPSKDFEDWLFQSDMAVIALFMAHLDQIVTICDDILSPSSNKVPSELKNFVRKVSNILKETDRGVFCNYLSLIELAKHYINFSDNLFVKMKAIFPENLTIQISSSLESISKIKPIINYWANNLNNLNEFQFTSIINSCSQPTILRANVSKDIVQNLTSVVALEMAPGNSSITHLLATINAALAQNLNNADKPRSAAEKAASIALEHVARPPYEPSVITKELMRLAKALSILHDKMEKYHPIDYLDLPTDTVDQNDHDGLFDGIEDRDIQNYLRDIQKYLIELSKYSIKSAASSNTKSSIITFNNEKYPALQEEITNITDCDKRGILSIDELINTLSKSQVISRLPKKDMLNMTFQNFQNFLLCQRLLCLKQQQISEFPIVISRLNQVQENEEFEFEKDDISASFDFIIKQFDKLNDHKSLKSIQRNYLPDQVLTQQIILSKLLHEQQMFPVSSSKFVKRLHRSMESLLNAAIEQLKTSNTKSFSDDEVETIINRGNSHMRLIQQLSHIQQLILSEDLEFIKFYQSPEGQEIIVMPLSLEQVSNEQKQIASEINLISKPDILSSLLKNYQHENSVIKMRVIKGLLNVLISNEAENFMIRPIEPTTNGILEAAFTEQNRQLVNNFEKDSVSSFIDTEIFTKAQQFSYSIYLRTNLLRLLLNAKGMQIVLNSNGAHISRTLKPGASVSSSDIDSNKDSIIMQVFNESPDNEIINLSMNELSNQQVILAQASSLIANGVVNLKINLKASLHSLMRSIQPEKIAEMTSNSDIFNGIKPLEQSEVCSSYLLNDYSNSKLLNAERIRFVINLFNISFPDLKQHLSNNPINADEIPPKRQICWRSEADIIISKPNNSSQRINSLTEDDRIGVYYTLLAEEKNIIENNSPSLTQFDLLEDQIFEIETSKQIMHEITLWNNKLKENENNLHIYNEIEINNYPSLLNIQNERPLIERALAASKVIFEVYELAKRRAALCPELTNHQMQQRIGEHNKKKISKLINNLKEQFENGHSLPKILIELTPEQRIIQQQMLQHLAKQLSKDQFIESSGIKIDNRDTQQDLVLHFLDVLLDQIVSNPNSLSLTNVISMKELVTICDQSPLHIARLSLYNKIMNYLGESIQSLKLEAFLNGEEAKSDEILLPFSYTDLKPIHELLRVSLSLQSKSSEILIAHDGFTEKSYAREIRAVNKLALQMKPDELILTNNQRFYEKKAGFALELNLFNQLLNDQHIKSVQTQESQQPKDEELHQNLLNMVRSVLSIVPTMFNLPSSETKSLLLTLIRQSLVKLSLIYNIPNLANYPNELNYLTNSMPQLVSSYIVIKNSLPSDLLVNPKSILQHMTNLSINGLSLNNVKCNRKFKSNLTKLINELRIIEASLILPLNHEQVRSVQNRSFSLLANSIQSLDVKKINFDFTGFNYAVVTSRGNNYNEIHEINESADELQKSVTKLYKSSIINLTEVDNKEKFMKLRQNLVDFINKNTNNPYLIIRSLQTTPDVQLIIKNSRNTLNSSLSHFTNSIRSNEKTSENNSLNDLINSISLAQAAMLRGFTIQNRNQFNVYSDAISMFSSALSNISVLTDSSRNKSSATIRRSVRSLNRTINQLSDELSNEEISRQERTTNDENKIELFKLQFAKSINQLAQFSLCTASVIASSQVPETRSTFTKAENEFFNSLILDLKECALNLHRINTDIHASENFSNEINNLLTIVSQFINESMDVKTEITIQQAISEIIMINKSLTSTIIASSNMTDVVPLTPDIAAADLLYKSFVLPQVPNDTFGLKVQDAFNPLDSLFKSFNLQIESTIELSSDKSFAQNSTIASEMNQAADKLTFALEQVLRVSTTIHDVEAQNELTNHCSAASNKFDSLLKMLRNKFLLKDNSFVKKGNKQAKSVTSSLNKIQKVAKKSLKQGIKDQEHSSLIQKLLLSFDKLIVAHGALQISIDRMRNKQSITNRDWAIRISEIELADAYFTICCLKRFKEEPERISNFDSLLSFVDLLIAECVEAHKISSMIENESSEDAEFKVIERTKKLGNINSVFIETGGEGTDEEKQLKNSLKSLNKNILYLQQSAEASIEANNITSKIKTQNKDNKFTPNSMSSPAMSFKKNLTRNDLLERLNLEANVIHARKLLEKSEKILKNMKK